VRAMRAALGLVISSVFVFACGPHHTDPGSDISKATLSVDPPTSMLVITNGAPATEDFTATLTFPDGTTTDVTADTGFAIDTEYGAFAASKLTMQVAGKTQVFATYMDKTANAEVIAMLNGVRVGPGVPANAPGLFNGPDNALRAPHLVYPPADVIMPRNVGDFEVHWTDASSNNVFEVSLKTDYADVRAYVAGGNGDGAAGPDPSYMAFLASEWASAVGTEKHVQLQIRGVDSANPVDVGSTPPQMVNLSNETMNGGLYYWASAGTEPEGIYRHDMSKPGQPAEPYYTTANLTGGAYRCVACHVLSRDGKKMMITYDGGDRQATTIDVATGAATAVAAGSSCSDSSTCSPGMGCVHNLCQTTWNFSTFSPDATQILTVFQGNLVVRDYASMTVLAQMASAGAVSHPDLSPDGTHLVYVRPTVAGSDWAFGTGQIFMRTYDQASMAFGPEQQLVADSNNNYYPSFSPDGQWILFNRGDNYINDGASQHESYNNPNATLWVVKADNSAPPVQLAAFDVASGLTNSWGRWAPFAQTYGAGSEQMYWVTVSSKRDFGVRLVGVQKPQIWMTPFFPDHASIQQDPSAAAFRLPFQDIATNNHIAQWTEQVVVTQ
jgi:hypothetical protein